MFDRTTSIASIMTRNVFFVHPNDTMQRVGELFTLHNIHHIPVIDNDSHVVGIISKADYLKILHGFTLFKTEKSQEYNKAILRSLLVSEEDVAGAQPPARRYRGHCCGLFSGKPLPRHPRGG